MCHGSEDGENFGASQNSPKETNRESDRQDSRDQGWSHKSGSESQLARSTAAGAQRITRIFGTPMKKNNISGCRFSMDSKNDGVATDSEDIKRWRFVRIQDRLFSNCLVRVNFHPRLDPTCFFRNIQLPQSTKTCHVPSTRHNLFGPRKA